MRSGTVVSGFRIERLIGTGTLGAVYEATQLSLSRSVALRLIGSELTADAERAEEFREQQTRAATFHHPRIVPVYEAGDWEGGKFVASRLIRGRTLAEFIIAERVSPWQLRALLEPVAAALDAAHAAGLVHGAVNEQNVLVDGTGAALLTDFGLGRPGSVAADREALVSLHELASSRSPRWHVTSSLAGAFLALGVAAVVGAGLVIALGSGASDRPGSIARTIGCAEDPGPNTPACTLSPATGSGGPLMVNRAGVIENWRVAGASGDLTLQVIRGDDERPFVGGFSQLARPPDAREHEFQAQVPVEPGDRIGVLLGPGATIGVEPGVPDRSVVRWNGALAPDPNNHGFERIDGEIQLEVKIEEGARPTPPAQLTGKAAAAAEAGRVLGSRFVDIETGRTVRVDLVRIERKLALDAFRAGRRLARIEVPDLRPGGELLNLDEFAFCGDRHGLCLRWLNKGAATPVIHAYRFTGRVFRLIA
jgi:hypothetical protein